MCLQIAALLQLMGLFKLDIIQDKEILATQWQQQMFEIDQTISLSLWIVHMKNKYVNFIQLHFLHLKFFRSFQS